MKKTLFTYLMLAAVVLVTASVFAQEKYQITARYPEGKFTMDQSSSSRMVADNSKSVRVFGQKQVFYYALEVSPAKDDGSRQMTMTIKRIGVSQKRDDLEISADTDEKVDLHPTIAKPLRAILGSGYLVTFDKDGKAVAFDGIDSITNEIVMAAPNPAAAQQAVGAINKEQILDSFNKVGKFLPKTPVALGDTWEFEEKIEVPIAVKKIELNIKTKCVLKEIEKYGDEECYRIESETVAKKADEEISFEATEGTASLESLNVESKTVLLIGKTSGMIRSAETASTTKLALAVKTPVGVESTFKTEATTTQKMTVSPIKSEPRP